MGPDASKIGGNIGGWSITEKTGRDNSLHKTIYKLPAVDIYRKLILRGRNMSNKLTEMAREILSIEADLPFRFNYSEKPYPTLDDFELYTFEQVWGSTALGFGGMGGQAMTSSRTYVFIPVNCNQKCFVYFGGRFAYKVDYSQKFMNDVLKGNVESVARAGKYAEN